MTPNIMDLYARVVAKNCPCPRNANDMGNLIADLRTDIDKEYFLQLVMKHWADLWEEAMLEHHGVNYG